MGSQSDFELFKLQRECIEELQKEQPDLFVAEKTFNEEEVLPEIGITHLLKDRPCGFLRLFPQDFIVEEIHSNGGLSCIEPNDNNISEPETEKFTLFADLIKVGISSLEAIKRLAKGLGVDVNKIGYAGIKDAQALTSQRIALPGARYEQIADLKCESFFLTNFSYGRGTISKGNLSGNRFSIFIRTEKELDNSWISNRLAELNTSGFLNYYHTQRFGGGRLLSHKLGKLILQGKYEETIKVFLTQAGKYDIKLIKTLRMKVREVYGDWGKMKEIFSLMPYTFRIEIKILKYLQENQNNFIGALIEIQDQTLLWVYAYDSFCFNRFLSELVQGGGSIPEKLPMLLSDDISDRDIYSKYLEQDEIIHIAHKLRPFKFIRFKKREITAKIFPKDVMGAVNPEGAIISFSLGKGSYATTFLMNLFRLQQGMPLPEWLKTTEYDIKEILKTGSVEAAKERLKDYIFSALDYQKNLKTLP